MEVEGRNSLSGPHCKEAFVFVIEELKIKRAILNCLFL